MGAVALLSVYVAFACVSPSSAAPPFCGYRGFVGEFFFHSGRLVS
jgi:hypothetical protein